MSNPYVDFYVEQAGTGLSHFTGTRFQRGRGVGAQIGSFLRTMVWPGLKKLGGYLKKKAVVTGGNIALDVLTGKPPADIIEKHGKDVLHQIVDDSVNKIKEKMNQRGTGRRRRRRRTNKSKYKGLLFGKKIIKRKRKRTRRRKSKSSILTALERRLR